MIFGGIQSPIEVKLTISLAIGIPFVIKDTSPVFIQVFENIHQTGTRIAVKFKTTAKIRNDLPNTVRESSGGCWAIY